MLISLFYFVLFFLQGTIGFEAQIDKCLELSEYLYNKIKDREGYEMVFNGKVSANFCGRVGTLRYFCLLLLCGYRDLIGAWRDSALCAMNAIFTSSCQYNVPLLSLINGVTACNCSYAYE